MKLIARPFSGTPLATAWMAGEPEAGRLFPGDPRSLEAFASKSKEVDARFGRPERILSASALRGGGSDAKERLDAFVERDGFMITTGQQPGLFTGPLYGLYKAMTAVALAERMAEALERPVLPVFWIASEDNDWDEVRTSRVLDVDNELQEIALPPLGAADANPPLHRIPAGEDVSSAVDRFLSLLPGTEFSARWSELLRDAYRPDRTLGDAFEEAMTALTGEAGLFFVQAHEPDLKNRSLPLLLRELRESEEREATLAELGRTIEAAGFDLQVPILEGATNLFLEADGGRERIFREGDVLRLRKSNRRLALAEVEAIVEEDPSVLSPNVLLRPVVESLLFPTLCYVAGPGEAAYLPQTAPVFAGHGIEQPLVHPRACLTAVERKVGKVLDKFQLGIDDLDRPTDELVGRLAREEIPEDVQAGLDAIRRSVGQETQALRKAVSQLDPTLTGPVESFRNQTFGNLDDVERKIVQSLKKANEVTLAQVLKAQLNLFPGGQPQERVFNPFYYLMRYDETFLADVRAATKGAVLP